MLYDYAYVGDVYPAYQRSDAVDDLLSVNWKNKHAVPLVRLLAVQL